MSRSLTYQELSMLTGIKCYDSFNDTYITLTPKNLEAYSLHEALDQLKPCLKPIRDLDPVEDIKAKEFQDFLVKNYLDLVPYANVGFYIANGFDVFKWIEAGLAIDATKVKYRTCRQCQKSDEDESLFWVEDDLCSPCNIQEGP